MPVKNDESSTSRAGWLHTGLALAIVAAVFAAFAPALSAGFVDWDDDRNFLQNASYRGLSLEHLKWMATTFHGGPYQPLSWLTLGIDHALWGMDARGYHLTNVVLHACGAVAFFYLALRLLPLCTDALRGKSLALGSASAALLFALHPLRVESVAWVTERRDVLSGIFFVLTISSYLRSRTSTEASARRRWYAISLAALCLCLPAKASGMGAPLVLLALDLWPLRRPLKEALTEKIPFVLLVLPFAMLALWGQAQQAHNLSSIAEHGAAERIAQAAYAAVFYPLKTLLPTGLAAIYDLPVPFDPLATRFVLALVCAAGTSIVLFALRHRAPAAWTAWIAFLVLLAPTSGLAKAGPQLVADRYSYLACMPFALFAAGALFVYVPRAALATSVAVSIALGALTWRQTETWHDSLTLYEHTVAVNPSSYIAHTNLGYVLSSAGRTDEALAHYTRALELHPGYALAHNSLAQILLRQGRLDEALAHFRSAAKIRPDYALARIGLSVALVQNGDLEAAEVQAREAQRLDPTSVPAVVNLGSVLLARGKAAEALVHYEHALVLDPDDADAHKNAAMVLGLQGRAKLAIEHYRAALAARPQWPEAEIPLAWILATHRNPELRNAAEAVALAQDAVASVSAPSARDLDTLAAAYAAAGRFEEARSTAQRALGVAKDPKLAAAIEARLKSYAAGQAYLSTER